jgi:hypothetical protein
MKIKNISESGNFRWMLSAACMATLVACSPAAPTTVVVPAPAAPATQVVVASPPAVDVSALVYYPEYEVYYDPGVHMYWYMDGNNWTRGERPPGVSIDVLTSARSVPMDFHDSPASHHAEVVQRYPRGAAPAGPDRGDHHP